MAKLDLYEICKQLCVNFAGPNLEIAGISTDTRSLQPGDLFIALQGENMDGHDYIDQAVCKGAVAVIVSKGVSLDIPVIKVSDTLLALGKVAACYRDKFSMPMVALTGSCGKTTVKNMITSILQQVGTVLSPEGSFNNEIGVPQTLLKLDEKYDYAVFEMGAKKTGDIEYLMQLVNPNIAFINNAAPAHIATFGDVDGVARVKGEIYQQLRADGIALLNVDDVYAPYWLSLLNGQQVITFGLESKADITCAYIVEEHHRVKFDLVTDLGNTEIVMNVLGVHNVMNALAATAAARALGVSLKHIKAGLQSFSPTTRRMQVKVGKNGARVIDDTYNANPLAMQRAIEVLAKQRGRKIMVIGDMLELGPQAAEIHAELGRSIKNSQIDALYAYGDLSRHAAEAFGPAHYYNDKQELAAALLPSMDQDTVVLVKGSNGMHLEEIINAIVAD